LMLRNALEVLEGIEDGHSLRVGRLVYALCREIGLNEGEEIPLCGRITAICDVYDALRSRRPYREAWTPDQAEAYIRDRRGRQFDPGLVDPFLRVVTRVNHPMAKARGL